MNTGVGDAFDLAWKLAGTIQGWGGPELLDGYERERRPIGRRNVDAAGWAAAGVPIWRALVTPDGLRRHARGRCGARPAGGVVRRRASAHARHGGRRSRLFLRRLAADRRRARRPNGRPAATSPRRCPARASRICGWTTDTALQDILGDDYTLLDLTGAPTPRRSRRRSAPAARRSPSFAATSRGCAASTARASSCCGRTCTSSGAATKRRAILRGWRRSPPAGSATETERRPTPIE